MRRALSTLLAVTWTVSAQAQDFGAGWGVSLGAGTINAMMGNLPLVAVQNRAQRGQRLAGPIVTKSMTYPVTISTERGSQAAFLDRLAKQSPQAAEQIGIAMRAHDFGKMYSGIVAPFGLHRGDAADALTSYLILGWIIANGSADPTRDAVAAVRSEIAARAATSPAFATEAARARFGEEMAIMFVILHSGWQSARKNGTLPQFSEQVAAMFRTKFGTDLHALALTERGFEARG